IAVVVREHHDVAPGRLPVGQQRLDLVVEGLVVVDVLGVVDVDAVLLLERDERGLRVVLLVLVDVERPVREVERLGELVRRCPAACTAAAASAAGGEESGDCEDGAARRSAANEDLAGDAIGHWVPSWESTTKVLSGLQLSVSRSPVATCPPGRSFCT